MGGVGKTRLATQVAAAHVLPTSRGACELRRGEPDAIAEALHDARRAAAWADLDDALLDFLRSKQVLLLLDNCEHLLDRPARRSPCTGGRLATVAKAALRNADHPSLSTSTWSPSSPSASLRCSLTTAAAGQDRATRRIRSRSSCRRGSGDDWRDRGARRPVACFERTRAVDAPDPSRDRLVCDLLDESARAPASGRFAGGGTLGRGSGRWRRVGATCSMTSQTLSRSQVVAPAERRYRLLETICSRPDRLEGEATPSASVIRRWPRRPWVPSGRHCGRTAAGLDNLRALTSLDHDDLDSAAPSSSPSANGIDIVRRAWAELVAAACADEHPLGRRSSQARARALVDSTRPLLMPVARLRSTATESCQLPGAGDNRPLSETRLPKGARRSPRSRRCGDRYDDQGLTSLPPRRSNFPRRLPTEELVGREPNPSSLSWAVSVLGLRPPPTDRARGSGGNRSATSKGVASALSDRRLRGRARRTAQRFRHDRDAQQQVGDHFHRIVTASAASADLGAHERSASSTAHDEITETGAGSTSAEDAVAIAHPAALDAAYRSCASRVRRCRRRSVARGGRGAYRAIRTVPRR